MVHVRECPTVLRRRYFFYFFNKVKMATRVGAVLLFLVAFISVCSFANKVDEEETCRRYAGGQVYPERTTISEHAVHWSKAQSKLSLVWLKICLKTCVLPRVFIQIKTIPLSLVTIVYKAVFCFRKSSLQAEELIVSRQIRPEDCGEISCRAHICPILRSLICVLESRKLQRQRFQSQHFLFIPFLRST